MGKSQTEALQVNTGGQGLRFSCNDWTVKVIKLFIIRHQQKK